MAFENCFCRDYVTEKFYRTLTASTAVPVVRGGANYSAIAPPNSYIDVANFSSPQHLANFLKRLDEDDRLYNKFHAWRRDYVYKGEPSAWCNLCQALNAEVQVPKYYEDIQQFWSKENNCAAL